MASILQVLDFDGEFPQGRGRRSDAHVLLDNWLRGAETGNRKKFRYPDEKSTAAGRSRVSKLAKELHATFKTAVKPDRAEVEGVMQDVFDLYVMKTAQAVATSG